jgi:hypothetical protein
MSTKITEDYESGDCLSNIDINVVVDKLYVSVQFFI